MKSCYDLATILSLNEAFKLETNSFYDLATLLRLCEAFMLETESLYELANLLRLWESYKLFTLSIYKLASLFRLQEVLSQKQVSYKHFERLWSFCFKVRFQQSKQLKKRNETQF